MSNWHEDSGYGGAYEPVPADREAEPARFVGGPLDGAERPVPLCRHDNRTNVIIDMPDLTHAHYGWDAGDQLYRFEGIEYPRAN